MYGTVQEIYKLVQLNPVTSTGTVQKTIIYSTANFNNVQYDIFSQLIIDILSDRVKL